MLKDAVDGFVAGGACFDAARARIDLATALTALGRPDAAAPEAAAALHCLLELGAEPEAMRARTLLTLLPDGDDVPLSALTPREREVLRLIVDGLTNREIAERLIVSHHTVHRHVTNLLRKLALSSRTAAAPHAVRAGLVERGDA